jgi:hypothetical protein
MDTVNLPVIKGVVDDMIKYHETQTVAVPINLCMDLFGEIPKPILQKLLPSTLRIRGFRTAAKAPTRMVFDCILHGDASWLGFIFSQYCVDVLKAISELNVKHLRTDIADLTQEYSAAMVRYALYVDHRKSVRNLYEQYDALVTFPATDEDHTVGSPAVPETAFTADPDQLEENRKHDMPAQVEEKQDNEGKTNVNSRLHKRLAKAEKLVAEREAQIRKMRQDKGERDRALGQLRHDLAEKQCRIDQLDKQLYESEQKVAQLRHLEQELDYLAERERKLELQERTFASLFGADAAELKNQLLDGAVRIQSLESQLACLHRLLTEQNRQRDALLGNLRHIAHVPVATCIDVVRQHLEDLLQQQISRIGQGAVFTATERLAQADTIQELLYTIATLERLNPDHDQVQATSAVEIPLAELKQQLASTEAVKLELVGTLRYEGPQVWLVTQGQVIGLPQDLLEQEDLVTGNQVRLVLYHDRHTLIDMDAEVIDRHESQVINDALRLDEEGLYVQSHSGQHIMISQYEFLRAQVEVGEPLQVIVPKWPYPKGSQALYGRIAKKLTHSGLYQRRRVVSTAPKKTHGESGPLELLPLLTGQNVLVVGGDGNEQCYQTVVEGMGGRFDFQSGFEQLTRIPGKVRSANLVILVTGCVLHAVGGLAQMEAKRTNTPCHFFNNLGRTSFIRFLEGLYANALEQNTAVS